MPRPRENNERLQARIDPETKHRIEELARLWGPVEPLSVSAVVRRIVDLAYRQEARIAATSDKIKAKRS